MKKNVDRKERDPEAKETTGNELARDRVLTTLCRYSAEFGLGEFILSLAGNPNTKPIYDKLPDEKRECAVFLM